MCPVSGPHSISGSQNSFITKAKNCNSSFEHTTTMLLVQSNLFFFFFFWLFRATPAAYGSSQARGQIGAAAAGHSHSNPRSEPHLRRKHNSWQHQILNPGSKPRDRTRIFMDTSQVRSTLSHKRNSQSNLFVIISSKSHADSNNMIKTFKM